MRRSIHLASAVLAALTAVALLGAAVAVRPPARPAEADGPDEAANRAVVYRFNKAVNAAIATGDLAPLAAVVAPDLLDDRQSPGLGWGHIGLRRRLLALRATNPGLRLTVEALAVDDDLTITRIGVDGAAASAPTQSPAPAPAFLGLPLVDRPALWSPVDLLRVADGRIVAYGDGRSETGVLEPVLVNRFGIATDSPRVVTLQRLTITAGAEHAGRAGDGPRLLLVEAGAPSVTIFSDRPDGRAGPIHLTPAVGEHLSIWPGARYAVRNVGEVAAVLLDVFVDAPAYSAAQPTNATRPPPEVGVETRVLAGGLAIETPHGPATLAIGRATLPPGAGLAWDTAAGPVLLYVEAGLAMPDRDAGDTWVRDGGSGLFVVLGDDQLAAGDGAIVKAGNRAAFRAGPEGLTTVLIVTLLPAGDPLIEGTTPAGPG